MELAHHGHQSNPYWDQAAVVAAGRPFVSHLLITMSRLSTFEKPSRFRGEENHADTMPPKMMPSMMPHKCLGGVS